MTTIRPGGRAACAAFALLAAMPVLAQSARPADRPARPPAPLRGACAAGEANFFRDEGLTVKLSSKLQFEKPLMREKIHVRVVGGVATLSGGVASRDHVALAGRVASQVEGVRCVNNLLRVGPPDPEPPLVPGG